jgi:hypothetical protein
VAKIHPGYTNPKGRYIRTIDVTCMGKNQVQKYRLTEVADSPRGLVEGEEYEFIVFLNGISRQGRHENNLLISRVYGYANNSLT